jgi:hypothetical protein
LRPTKLEHLELGEKFFLMDHDHCLDGIAWRRPRMLENRQRENSFQEDL